MALLTVALGCETREGLLPLRLSSPEPLIGAATVQVVVAERDIVKSMRAPSRLREASGQPAQIGVYLPPVSRVLLNVAVLDARDCPLAIGEAVVSVAAGEVAATEDIALSVQPRSCGGDGGAPPTDAVVPDLGPDAPPAADTTPAPSDGPPVAHEANEYARLICLRLRECLPNVLAARHRTVQGCEDFFRHAASVRASARDTSWSRPALLGCQTQLLAMTCGEVAAAAEVQPWPACDALLIGRRALGATCGVHEQCTSGLCVYTGPIDSSCGVCARRAARGELCNTTACELGTICGATTQRCQLMNASGQPCTPGENDCRLGLYCRPDATGGRCATRGGVDAPCDPAGDVRQCDFGMFCSVVTRTCKFWTIAENGQQCGVNGDDYSFCRDQGFCQMTAGQSTPACLPRTDRGQPCASDANCRNIHRCVRTPSASTATCELFVPLTTCQ